MMEAESSNIAIDHNKVAAICAAEEDCKITIENVAVGIMDQEDCCSDCKIETSTPICEETCVFATMTSSDSHHYVKQVKVVGVHKRERPTTAHLFVMLVKYCDDCSLTIYRRYSEIKNLHKSIRKMIKHDPELSTGDKYLRKLFRRIQTCAQFVRGTMARLKLVDFINVYFEAMTHYAVIAQSEAVIEFCKPTPTDLNSAQWSCDGKTYFYVSRHMLSHTNSALTNDKQECGNAKELSVNNVPYQSQVRTSFASIDTTNSDMTEYDSNSLSSQISHPIQSSIYVALCDYEEEDKNHSILKIKKDEEVEVLVKDESGWWLVQKIPQVLTNLSVPSKQSNGEFGYVPATYLAEKMVSEFDKSITIDDLICKEKVKIQEPNDNLDTSDCSVDEDPGEGDEDNNNIIRLINSDGQSIVHKSLVHLDSYNITKRTNSPLIGRSHRTQYNRSPSAGMLRGTGAQRMIANKARKDIFNNRCNAIREMEGRERSNSLTNIYENKRLTNLLTENSDSVHSLDARRSSNSSNISLSDRIYLMKTAKSMSYLAAQKSEESLTRTWSVTSSNESSHSSDYAQSSPENTEYISKRKYMAQRPDELSFPENAVISITKKSSDGWWQGRYNGNEGVVPGVYLRPYNDPLRRLSIEVTRFM